jgi:hypothetical protein
MARRYARAASRQTRPTEREHAAVTYPSRAILARRSRSASVGLSRAKEPVLTAPARRYVVMSTPVVDVFVSASASPAGTVPSPKSRFVSRA